MNELKQIRTMAEIIIEKVDALAGAMPEHELTKVDREWYSGPPPHVGWWNASNAKCPITWRWWNGTTWSVAAYEGNSAEQVERKARTPLEPIWCKQTDIYWSDYWPANARVPRINPGVEK